MQVHRIFCISVTTDKFRDGKTQIFVPTRPVERRKPVYAEILAISPWPSTPKSLAEKEFEPFTDDVAERYHRMNFELLLASGC